jgi:hypothetical protein
MNRTIRRLAARARPCTRAVRGNGRNVAIDPDGRVVVIGGKRVALVDASDGAPLGTRAANGRGLR